MLILSRLLFKVISLSIKIHQVFIKQGFDDMI